MARLSGYSDKTSQIPALLTLEAGEGAKTVDEQRNKEALAWPTWHLKPSRRASWWDEEESQWPGPGKRGRERPLSLAAPTCWGLTSDALDAASPRAQAWAGLNLSPWTLGSLCHHGPPRCHC